LALQSVSADAVFNSAAGHP